MEGRSDAGKHSIPKAASRVRFLPNYVTDGGQEIAIFEESKTHKSRRSNRWRKQFLFPREWALMFLVA